jgi:hypothetical protein
MEPTSPCVLSACPGCMSCVLFPHVTARPPRDQPNHTSRSITAHCRARSDAHVMAQTMQISSTQNGCVHWHEPSLGCARGLHHRKTYELITFTSRRRFTWPVGPRIDKVDWGASMVFSLVLGSSWCCGEWCSRRFLESVLWGDWPYLGAKPSQVGDWGDGPAYALHHPTACGCQFGE